MSLEFVNDFWCDVAIGHDRSMRHNWVGDCGEFMGHGYGTGAVHENKIVV